MVMSIVEPVTAVTGGVDTHKQTHVAAALDQLGRVLGTQEFPVTPIGYVHLLAWLQGFGPVVAVGVEGTGSWGAALARFLTDQRIAVIEVDRPNRQRRRRRGKSDPTDAIAAARAVQSGEASGVPKTQAGPVECIRLLRLARSSAVKARTQAANQLHAIVVTAPEPLASLLRDLTIRELVKRAARYQPKDELSEPAAAAKFALRSIARRWLELTAEIKLLDRHLSALVRKAAPEGLLAKMGVSTEVAGALLVAAGDNPQRLGSEAAFAALCGVSPVEASSGAIVRHRLNRGGNRQANSALWRIVVVRMRWHEATRDYITRRTQEGKTKREIMRCLKRHVAREIYRHLQTAFPTPKPTAQAT